MKKLLAAILALILCLLGSSKAFGYASDWTVTFNPPEAASIIHITISDTCEGTYGYHTDFNITLPDYLYLPPDSGGYWQVRYWHYFDKESDPCTPDALPSPIIGHWENRFSFTAPLYSGKLENMWLAMEDGYHMIGHQLSITVGGPSPGFGYCRILFSRPAPTEDDFFRTPILARIRPAPGISRSTSARSTASR